MARGGIEPPSNVFQTRAVTNLGYLASTKNSPFRGDSLFVFLSLKLQNPTSPFRQLSKEKLKKGCSGNGWNLHWEKYKRYIKDCQERKESLLGVFNRDSRSRSLTLSFSCAILLFSAAFLSKPLLQLLFCFLSPSHSF